jgi:hypothetical protein
LFLSKPLLAHGTHNSPARVYTTISAVLSLPALLRY